MQHYQLTGGFISKEQDMIPALGVCKLKADTWAMAEMGPNGWWQENTSALSELAVFIAHLAGLPISLDTTPNPACYHLPALP